ncbi:MAG: adenosylcobinamide-GDP ribazoletransferase [Syntrophobacteraceae bacterium]
MLRTFSTALSFLTIFRFPFLSSQTPTQSDLAKSFAFYPLVGLLLGTAWFASALIFYTMMPPFLLATIMTTLMVVLTRALHLDGLADLADGIGGGYTPERRLEIMKDSRTGAFGALALILAVMFKVSALSAIIQSADWLPLLLVPALSRFGMVLTAYKSPYARREGGLGKPFVENLTAGYVAVAAIISLLVSVMLAFPVFPFYIVAVLACVAFIRCFCGKCLGGITGDVLGATNELSEVVLLAVAVCCK